MKGFEVHTSPEPLGATQGSRKRTREKSCDPVGARAFAITVPFPRVWRRVEHGDGEDEEYVSPLGGAVPPDKISQWWSHPAALVAEFPLSSKRCLKILLSAKRMKSRNVSL